ncbi:unnamed protein product [marine sediment metagenome]|uniref:Uncharacterized protein n=1 Tax=marine sediment metagenome TaxID=412755 RepID=X1EWI3_9ZZZZ
MTAAELKTLLQTELKGLAAKFVSDDYDNAITSAEQDTGWSMPVTDDFKIKWMRQRAKRHLFSYRRDESADKFKYKQLSLNQRFDHFFRLIENMDRIFEKAKEESAFEFAGVGALNLFGTKVDAGFAYEEQTGRDMTYSSSNEIIIHPDENS